ncbi:hypothetical protein NQ317_018114 [Molorchus minor]|uniref:Uncharacterized protein n=1 Tax=Molorchus minor TaxID=1323400 RepID=A0ABQ9JEL5_9CUCU|nr:hypothetical protein NQ317_018114 [Molorchus minor]
MGDDSSPDLSLKLRRGSSDSRDSFYMDFDRGIDSDIDEMATTSGAEHADTTADTTATPTALGQGRVEGASDLGDKWHVQINGVKVKCYFIGDFHLKGMKILSWKQGEEMGDQIQGANERTVNPGPLVISSYYHQHPQQSLPIMRRMSRAEKQEEWKQLGSDKRKMKQFSEVYFTYDQAEILEEDDRRDILRGTKTIYAPDYRMYGNGSTCAFMGKWKRELGLYGIVTLGQSGATSTPKVLYRKNINGDRRKYYNNFYLNNKKDSNLIYDIRLPNDNVRVDLNIDQYLHGQMHLTTFNASKETDVDMNELATEQYITTRENEEDDKQKDVLHEPFFWHNGKSRVEIRTIQGKIMNKYMNQKIDPCNDFYEFACGNWKNYFTIPPDRSSYDTFEMVRENLDFVLRNLLQHVKEKPMNLTYFPRRNTFYQSCMQENIIKKRGDKPLQKILTQLGGWPIISKNWTSPDFDVIWLLATLRLLNNDVLIAQWVGPDMKNSNEYIVHIDQPTLGLPSREYYLNDSNIKYVKAYKVFILTVAKIMGAWPEIAEKDAEDIIQFEVQLADIMASVEERKNISDVYLRSDIASLTLYFPQFGWKEYFDIVLGKDINLKTPVACYCARYLHELLYLLSNTEPRTLQKLPYLEIYTIEMTKELEEAFKNTLSENTWLDDHTKDYARMKLDYVDLKIGYPDFILNKTELDMRYYDVRRRMGSVVNRTMWSTPPAVVNAYYSRNKNQIMFPAGMLQPPFYNRHFPKALNFGGIGVVIGHEITHGFDDKGRLFDHEGNLHLWWRDSSIEKFYEKSQCMIEQYDQYIVPEIRLALDGYLTQGENIADNGGLKQAYRAYENWLGKHPKADETLPELEQAKEESISDEESDNDSNDTSVISNSYKPRKTSLSIVHKHNHYGSFYLRMGAVAFGIGSMIYSGLEFGQYFEVEQNTKCHNVLLALTPATRMVFIFIQMYFIFLNNEQMRVYKHKLAARFGLMHMIGTNLSVWLNVLVQETKHEILTFYNPENDSLKISHRIPYKGNVLGLPIVSSDHPPEAHGHHIVARGLKGPHHLYECRRTNIIGSLVQDASPFLFPCTIEYSLICAAILYVMWRSISKLPPTGLAALKSNPEMNQYKKSPHHYSVDCARAHKGLFVGIFLLVLTIISLILFFVLISRVEFIGLAVVEVNICELALYGLTTVASIVGMWQVRQLKYDGSKNLQLDNILLIGAQTGMFIYSTFTIIGGQFTIQSSTVLVLVTALASLLQTTCQTIFILDASRRSCVTPDQMKKKPGRENCYVFTCYKFGHVGYKHVGEVPGRITSDPATFLWLVGVDDHYTCFYAASDFL